MPRGVAVILGVFAIITGGLLMYWAIKGTTPNPTFSPQTEQGAGTTPNTPTSSGGSLVKSQ